MGKKPFSNPTEKALFFIKKKGGIIRTADALQHGIHSRTLYLMKERGVIEKISRGVYCLSEKDPVSNPDLVTVAVRFPRAVICLVSALSFHGITNQIPHAVWIALEKGAESPRIKNPPLSVHRFSRESLSAGVDVHNIDGVDVRIYSPEKTIADCFKFRNKIGIDIVIEALPLYKARKNFNSDALLKYAGICRVESIMKPYLEAII